MNCLDLYILFASCTLTYFLARFFYNAVSADPRYDKNTVFTLNDILSALNTVIEIQFTIYENNIFKDDHSILSSATFENYYKDLTSHVIKTLSPPFFIKASLYFNEDAIIELICSMTKEYLEKKIKNI